MDNIIFLSYYTSSRHCTTGYVRNLKQLALFCLTIFVFCSSMACAGRAVDDQAEPELMIAQFPTDSDMNIQSNVITSQTDATRFTDDLDTHRDGRRHWHHRRHHKSRDNSTSEEFDNTHLVEQQEATNHGEICTQGRIPDNSPITWENDMCQICRCQATRVECEEKKCPELSCENPVQVENECCQMCPEKICQAADGRRFRDGAEWHLDDCTYCECRKGRVLCSVEDCEFKSCASPVKIPGQCCPVCPDTSCHEENGSNHTAGAVWKKGDCTHCYCRKGEKVCAQEKCPHINCSHPFRRPGECCYRCQGAIDCIVSTWGSWGECPIQECGGGMRRRYRSVVIPPRHGGSFCAHMSEAQMCPRLPCDEIPVCPVTTWGSWSHCTATCGSGRRLRMRKKAKVTKATMTSLIDCSQTHMQESMRCYTGTCDIPLALSAVEEDNDHCLEATWLEWGPCSVRCGVGVRTRQQILLNSSHPLGHLCHLLRETKQCHGHDCKGSQDNAVNCKVTSWSPWTPCSATCGERAAKSKHRSILRHPSPEGRPCPRLQMTRSCRLPPCVAALSEISDSDESCVSSDGLRHYAENERWDPLECLACQCVNSRKVCQRMSCPPPECDNPTKFPGFCCPFCLGD